MRFGSIYQTQEKLILCSNATTVDGVGISASPYIHLPIDATDKQIVSAVIEIIETNKFGVAHPAQNEWRAITKQHFELLGIKPNSVMNKQMIHCRIQEKENGFLFIPTKKEGINGYLHIPEMALTVSRISKPEQIATTLKEALQISFKYSY